MKTLVHHLIEAQAQSAGDSSALVYKDQTITYGELWQQVRAAARGLCKIGVQPRDRVAVYVEKRIETVVSFFGASAADGAFVPINPVLRPAQVAYILADSNATVLVTSSVRLETLVPELHTCPDLKSIVVIDDPGMVGDGIEPQIVAWAHFMTDVDGPLDLRSIDVDM